MSLKHNTLWNIAGLGFPLLIGLITIPYLIREMGVEAFGILTLVWALIGYFSLFDFGLGRALTQRIAAARFKDQVDKIPSLIKSGLIFTAAFGVFGAFVLAAFSSQLAMQWLKVSFEFQSVTHNTLLIAAIGIPLTTITTSLRGVLEAYEDFKNINLLRFILGLSNFGLPALVVAFFGNHLEWIVFGLIVSRFVILLCHLLLINNKLALTWYQAPATIKNTKDLFSFGVWMTISNIISPLMVSADRFVISSVLGASIVAFYTVPFELISRLLLIPAALAGSLFPRVAYVLKSDISEVERLYKKCLLLILLVMLPICMGIALSSKLALTFWLGEYFADNSWVVLSLLAIGVLFNGIALIPYTIIQAVGDARSTGLLHIFELFIYIPLLFLLLKIYGLNGAAMAWSIRTGIDLIFLLIIANKKILSFKREI